MWMTQRSIRLVLSAVLGSAVTVSTLAQDEPIDQLAPAAEDAQAKSADERQPIDFNAWPDRRLNIILPPAWAFGVLYGGYTNQEETLEKARALQKGGFPVDAMWIDSWYWDYVNNGDGPAGYIDFIGDRKSYPDPRAMNDELTSLGIKSGVWVWDRLLQKGNEAAWEEFESRGFLHEPFMQGGWHTDGTSPSAIIRFEHPPATAHWQQRLKPLFDDGFDFLKIDAEATVPYMQAAFEATQRFGQENKGRGFILSHINTPHGEHDPRAVMYPAKWTGDAAAQWSQADYPNTRSWALGGLREQVALFASSSGPARIYPFLTCDTGGFRHGQPSDELFIRWSQFSSFLPLMQVFGSRDTRLSNSPLAYNKAAQESFITHTTLRLRLFPYLYSLAHLARLTNQNPIRPTRYREDQFMLGPGLLIAPVVEPSVTERHVYIPAGKWTEFTTGEIYDTGTLGTTRRVSAPLERIPVLAAPGAIIPMRPAASSIATGSNASLEVHVYPGGWSKFPLIEDDGESNGYQLGEFAVTWIRCREASGSVELEIAPVRGRYEGMLDERHFTFKIHGLKQPLEGTLNGKPLSPQAQAKQGEPFIRVEANQCVVSFTHQVDAASHIVIKPLD